MSLILAACGSSSKPGTASAGSTNSGSNATSPAVGKDSSPLVFGAVLALSGAVAGFDVPIEKSLQAGVAEINASGGIMGHQVLFKAVDDASDPTKVTLATEKLLADHPVFVMPDVVDTLTEAVLPLPRKTGSSR